MRNQAMMMAGPGGPGVYKMARQSETSAEILLYGPIGQSFWGDSVTASQFKKDLKALGDVKNIDLRINSEGGSVFDAAAIYNHLKEHSAHIIAHVDGMALSAASVVLMAGDERRMAENAFLMIHDPWSVVMGDARSMRKEADLLDSIKGTIVGMYAARTGQERGQLERLMADETWMTADEAIDLGFIDTISENLKVAAHFDVARFGYSKVPDWAANRSKADAPEPDLVRRAKLARMDQHVRKHR